MKYFKKLTQPQKISLFVWAIAAVAFTVFLNMPFQVTLTTSASSLELAPAVELNLPCHDAQLQPGDQTIVETSVTGKGYANVSYLQENGQLKLHLIGILRDIDCTLNIQLKAGDSINLPAPMAFVAREGVHPLPLNSGLYRTFKYELGDKSQ